MRLSVSSPKQACPRMPPCRKAKNQPTSQPAIITTMLPSFSFLPHPPSLLPHFLPHLLLEFCIDSSCLFFCSKRPKLCNHLHSSRTASLCCISPSHPGAVVALSSSLHFSVPTTNFEIIGSVDDLIVFNLLLHCFRVYFHHNINIHLEESGTLAHSSDSPVLAEYLEGPFEPVILATFLA